MLLDISVFLLYFLYLENYVYIYEFIILNCGKESNKL